MHSGNFSALTECGTYCKLPGKEHLWRGKYMQDRAILTAAKFYTDGMKSWSYVKEVRMDYLGDFR